MMKLEGGYTSTHNGKTSVELKCGHCGKFLGWYDYQDGKESYSGDIGEWNYCPYCGDEIEIDYYKMRISYKHF